jgi:hypothetical protein
MRRMRPLNGNVNELIKDRVVELIRCFLLLTTKTSNDALRHKHPLSSREARKTDLVHQYKTK